MLPLNSQGVAYGWGPYGQILPFYFPNPQSQANFVYIPVNYSPLTIETLPNQAPRELPAQRQPTPEHNSPIPVPAEEGLNQLNTRASLRSVVEANVSKTVQRRNGRERRQTAQSGYPTELLINPKRNTDRFIKKNTESNIVNQIFSYLWSPEKSQAHLEKILDKDLIPTFYQVTKGLKGGCRVQLNRQLLLRLVNTDQWTRGNSVLKKKAEQLGEKGALALRRLVLLYLREAGYLSILTSKKMNPNLWGLHLSKCRELIRDLFEAAS